MSEVVKMPRLSDTMEEGVLIKWHKKVGDKVEEGDLLAEIETDKATMEFESFQSGYLLRIDAKEGENVKVDASICILGNQDEKIIAASNPNAATQETPEPKEEQVKSTVSIPDGVEVVSMPKLSDTMDEGVLVKWHKEIGDKVAEGDLLAEIETDKATMEFESFQPGFLIHKGISEGKSAKVDDMIAILSQEKDIDASLFLQQILEQKAASINDVIQKKETILSQEKTSTPSQNSQNTTRIKASPLAKKIASHLKLNLAEIQGSGEGGRVIKRDVENYKPSVSKQGPLVTGKSIPQQDSTLPLSQMRKAIAKRLSQSKFSAPHYYLSIDVNVRRLKAAREILNQSRDSRISYNDFVIKAVSKSLENNPSVNSSWGQDEVITHGGIHIGVAVAIEEGLIVPTLWDANKKTLSGINQEVKDLAKKAKEKKLSPKEIEGSTFTISNLGMFGIQSFTSIINQPNTAILSVGAILETPIVESGEVIAGSLMNLTLACDHRVIDGATAATFLKSVQQNLEEPLNMLV